MRVHGWQQFKSLVKEKQPGSLVYVLEQNGLSPDKEVTILRLIMLHNRQYFIFIDTPKGEALRETGILLRKNTSGQRYLEEDYVRAYLKKEFEGEKIEFFYFWTS